MSVGRDRIETWSGPSNEGVLPFWQERWPPRLVGGQWPPPSQGLEGEGVGVSAVGGKGVPTPPPEDDTPQKPLPPPPVITLPPASTQSPSPSGPVTVARTSPVAPPHQSLAIIGEKNVGKTVLAALLWDAFRNDTSGNHYHVQYGVEGFSTVARIKEILASGDWPPGNLAAELRRIQVTIEWDHHLSHQVRTLHFMDVPGEGFKNWFSAMAEQPNPPPEYYQVAHAAAYLILLDPMQPNLLSMDLNLSQFLNKICEANQLRPQDKFDKPIAVAFTKYDALPPVVRKDFLPEKFAHDNLPQFYDLLRWKVPNGGLMGKERHMWEAISAVGNTRMGPRGDPVPALPFAPYKVATVISWLADRLPKQKG